MTRRPARQHHINRVKVSVFALGSDAGRGGASSPHRAGSPSTSQSGSGDACCYAIAARHRRHQPVRRARHHLGRPARRPGHRLDLQRHGPAGPRLRVKFMITGVVLLGGHARRRDPAPPRRSALTPTCGRPARRPDRVRPRRVDLSRPADPGAGGSRWRRSSPRRPARTASGASIPARGSRRPRRRRSREARQARPRRRATANDSGDGAHPRARSTPGWPSSSTSPSRRPPPRRARSSSGETAAVALTIFHDRRWTPTS